MWKLQRKGELNIENFFFSSFPKCTWPWNFPTNWECIKRPLLGLNKCQKAVSIVLGISLVQQTCVSDQIPTNKMGLVNQITNNLDKVWKSMKNWKEYCMQMMEKWKNIRLSNLYCHAISMELYLKKQGKNSVILGRSKFVKIKVAKSRWIHRKFQLFKTRTKNHENIVFCMVLQYLIFDNFEFSRKKSIRQNT